MLGSYQALRSVYLVDNCEYNKTTIRVGTTGAPICSFFSNVPTYHRTPTSTLSEIMKHGSGLITIDAAPVTDSCGRNTTLEDSVSYNGTWQTSYRLKSQRTAHHCVEAVDSTRKAHSGITSSKAHIGIYGPCSRGSYALYAYVRYATTTATSVPLHYVSF
jgi:hypothetical protein